MDRHRMGRGQADRGPGQAGVGRDGCMGVTSSSSGVVFLLVCVFIPAWLQAAPQGAGTARPRQMGKDVFPLICPDLDYFSQ